MEAAEPLERAVSVLLSLLACAASPETSGGFVAATYNVHGLPPEITGDDTAARMAQIAPRLDRWDVIGLQEDFDDDNHDTLAAGVDYASEVRFDELVESDRFYGPGLATFARFPEQDRLQEHFEACYGTLDNASDCLASKGFQALRLELAEGGATVDLYDSHLEAGGGDEDNAARETQVDQLIAAMNGWSAGRAVIFLGDTNLHEDDPADLPVIERWLEEAGLTDACGAVDCEGPGDIDRIFFRSGDEVSLEVLGWADEGADFVDDRGEPLSDHDPISAQIAWSSE
jgi:endonuclease/exonuclease/phosphatase family metal-dependent hydrolase